MGAIGVGMRFRFVFTDLRTGNVLAALPLHKWSFSMVLNGAGSLKASLRLPADPVFAGVYLDAVQPGKRAVYVEYGRQVVWAGIVWVSEPDSDTNTVQIDAAELWSYWRRRIIRWSGHYNGDQFSVVRQLLRRSAIGLGASINVAWGGGFSGIQREKSYREWEERNLAAEIEELAELEDGFDFWIEVVKINGRYHRRFRTAYPHRGTPDPQRIWTLGQNMVSLRMPSDASKMANSWVGVGAGEGVDVTISQAVDLDSLDDGYPLLEATAQAKDTLEQGILDALTRGRLNDTSTPILNPSAVVLIDSAPVFGTYVPGDTGRLRVIPGSDPTYPAGVDITPRILSIAVTEPPNGAPATAALIFEELAA